MLSITPLYTHNRTPGFLRMLQDCVFNLDDKVILVETGDPYDGNYSSFLENVVGSEIIKTEGTKRTFTEVAALVVSIARRYNPDFVGFLDNDYHLNPWYFSFAKEILMNNPQVDFLCLLNGECERKEVFYLSGFRFFKGWSCMGGSLIMRWSVAEPLLKRFFKEHPNSWAFDIDFMAFLRKVYDPFPIYTTADFSLCQHCNMVSGVLSTRAGVYSHTYALNYDPRCNPWKLRENDGAKP